MAEGKRNLVLGAVEHMGWKRVRPFAASLARTGFDGEVRLVVADLSIGTRRALEQEGCMLQPYRRLPRKLRSGLLAIHGRFLPAQWLYQRAVSVLAAPAHDRLRARGLLMSPISVAHVARYFHYYDFLTTTETEYESVMLTDTRDVFFQRDPFDFEVGDSVDCFLEDDGHCLSDEAKNAIWIRMVYGERTLEEIGRNLISCSGVTIGSYAAVVAYLRVMVEWLTRLERQVPGIDQAVHNYVIYKGLVPNLRLVRNGRGPVLTMGIMPRVEPDDLVGPDGRPYNVLHQYDRHPRIKELLLNRLEED